MTRLEDANKANLGLSKQPVLGKRYKTLQKYRLINSFQPQAIRARRKSWLTRQVATSTAGCWHGGLKSG
jgi:hypothetical protein